jgi:hypothetical protein
MGVHKPTTRPQVSKLKRLRVWWHEERMHFRTCGPVTRRWTSIANGACRIANNSFAGETRLGKSCTFLCEVCELKMSVGVVVSVAYRRWQLLSCFCGAANTKLCCLRVVTSLTTNRSYRRISSRNNTDRWVDLWDADNEGHFPTSTGASYKMSDLHNLRKFKEKNWISNIFDVRYKNSFLRVWKRNETRVEEEYCWVITQAAGRSCCGRSGFPVLEFGLSWIAFYVHVYLIIWISKFDLRKIRLAPHHSECDSCVSRGVSIVLVCIKQYFSVVQVYDVLLTWLLSSYLLFVPFLGAFAKFRKVAVSFVMPVCLSVRPHGTAGLPQDGFLWNLILEDF